MNPISSTSEKTDAIVLRMVDWSETSAVVTMFTRDHGRISAIAKGAYRPKGPFESALDLLTTCRIVFICKTSDALDILTEAKLLRRFKSGQRNLLPLYCGYYIAELLLELTEEGQGVPELFDLIDLTLQKLDEGDDPAGLVLRFELQCLRMLGLLPNFENCTGCTADLSDAPHAGFGLLAGGILCPNCIPGQRQVIRLRRQTIELFRKLCDSNWDNASIEPNGADCRGESRGIMNRYMTNLVSRKLRMLPYLGGLA